MLSFYKSKRGQSVAEYAVVIGTITAALAALSFWINGALQGRIKSLANQIGEKPYAPRNTVSSSFSTTHSSSTEEYSEGRTETSFSEETNTEGEESVEMF